MVCLPVWEIIQSLKLVGNLVQVDKPLIILCRWTNHRTAITTPANVKTEMPYLPV